MHYVIDFLVSAQLLVELQLRPGGSHCILYEVLEKIKLMYRKKDPLSVPVSSLWCENVQS
jgi:hypothetical protein